MPLELRRSQQARRDLIEIWRYIAADSPSAADKLLRGIDAAFAHAADFPNIGRALPDVGPNVRVTLYRRYMIIYSFDEATRVIELIRVIHGARRWQDMLS